MPISDKNNSFKAWLLSPYFEGSYSMIIYSIMIIYFQSYARIRSSLTLRWKYVSASLNLGVAKTGCLSVSSTR